MAATLRVCLSEFVFVCLCVFVVASESSDFACSSEFTLRTLALAMAPKICYDAADMQQKAEKSLEQEIRNAWKEGVSLPSSAEFTCEYLGVLTDDGFKLEARPTLRSTVGHKWSYRDNTVNVSQTKKARYDYSVEHGTSMPEQWKTALKCRRLSVIARESAALLQAALRCRGYCRSTLSWLRKAPTALP